MRFTDRLGRPLPIDDVFRASLRHVKIRLKSLDRRRQRHALRLHTQLIPRDLPPHSATLTPVRNPLAW